MNRCTCQNDTFYWLDACMKCTNCGREYYIIDGGYVCINSPDGEHKIYNFDEWHSLMQRLSLLRTA